MKKATVNVQGTAIAILSQNEKDFICLTDMASQFGGNEAIQNWMRLKQTIDYLGIWEKFNNPDFNSVEFDRIKNEAGINSFRGTIKQWVSATNAIGVFAKTGKTGGTFADKNIAFKFGSWLSQTFEIYLYEALKNFEKDKLERSSSGWQVKRDLTKLNYRSLTDAIKKYLIPPNLTREQEANIYAIEADIVNLAVFGRTAAEWKSANLNKAGNERDYSSALQLAVLLNIEHEGALLIENGISRHERIKIVNASAAKQFKALANLKSVKRISEVLDRNTGAQLSIV